MGIFEFAMEKEKLSEEYYRKIAPRAPDVGLKNRLTMLADEEHRHYGIVRQMSEGVDPQITDTNVLADAQALFAKMKPAADKFKIGPEEIDLYRKAQDIEKDSRSFYLEKVREVENPRQADIFKRLADEEDKHCFLLENIIDFISRPLQWLENAEWHHLEEY